MENRLSYLEKLIKVILWPIIFIVGHFFIEYVFVAYYNSKNKGDLSNSEFLKVVKTCDYQEGLNNFINSKLLLITIIFFLIFLPILCLAYKKYRRHKYIEGYGIESIALGISIALIFNITLYNLNRIFNFTNRFGKMEIPFYVLLICTGILGPILEEILFRGIVYNKLKTFNTNMAAIIICSILFGIFHMDIINGIYGFGISFILIYLYEKHNTLFAPILLHITANVTGLVIIKLGILSILPISIALLIVSVLIIIFIRRIYIKGSVE